MSLLSAKKTSCWLALPVLLVLAGCGRVDRSAIDNLHDGRIIRAGHAGMGFVNVANPWNPLPSNSMRSLITALDLGAEGLEVDLQITADSVLVLYHDKELDSKTGSTGCIPELPASAVVGQPYVCGFPYDSYHNEAIISLEELLVTLSQRDTFPWLYLDIHAFNYCNKEDGYAQAQPLANALGHLLDQHPEVPQDRIVPISTVPDLLLRIRDRNPGLFLVLEETADFDHGLERTLEYNFPGIAIKPKLLDAEKSARAHAHGLEVITFGGKTKSGLANLVEMNPDVIQADNIRALLEVLP